MGLSFGWLEGDVDRLFDCMEDADVDDGMDVEDGMV
jgi:hypothetical protein